MKYLHIFDKAKTPTVTDARKSNSYSTIPVLNDVDLLLVDSIISTVKQISTKDISYVLSDNPCI